MRLRSFVRKSLTRIITVQPDARRKKAQRVHVEPNEKLVLGITFAICALLSLVALEIVYLLVLRVWSSEIFASITGLIGTIVGVFFGVKA